MSLESKLYTALATCCPRVYPEVAPNDTTAPWITYQQIGGTAPTYLDRTVPDVRNALLQINVWSTTRVEANAIAQAIETALTTSTAFAAKPSGALMSTYENDTRLYGALQRFDIWDSR